MTDAETWHLRQVIGDIKSMPSAQPNLQPTCNQLATDCISRQEALDALRICYDTELIRPTTKKEIVTLAKKRGISINELVNQILDLYLASREETRR